MSAGRHRATALDTDFERGKVSAIVGGVILAVAAIVIGIVVTTSHTPTKAADGSKAQGLVLGASASATDTIPSPTSISPPSPTPSRAPAASLVGASSGGVPKQYAAISVSVYNTSGERGLAAKVAKRLLETGWNVRNVSGVSYAVSASTVFYDPPGKVAAEWMAAHDVTVHRALPRPKEFIATGGLIVLVKAGAV